MAKKADGTYFNLVDLEADRPYDVDIGATTFSPLLCVSFDTLYPYAPSIIYCSVNADGGTNIEMLGALPTDVHKFDPNLNNEFQIATKPATALNPVPIPTPHLCRCTYQDSTGAINPFGNAITLVRTAFDGGNTNGDLHGHQTNCCFKDANNNFQNEYSNTTITPAEDPTVQANMFDTCDFKFRSLSGPACEPLVDQYCVNDYDSLIDFEAKWTGGTIGNLPTHNCWNAFQRKVSANDFIPPGKPNSSGGMYFPTPQPVSKDIVRDTDYASTTATNIFNKLVTLGVDITAGPNDPNFHPATGVLYQLCQEYPFACKKSLDSFCAKESSDSLLQKPGLGRWCGCHLPPDAYGKYVDVYKVSKSCSPSCNQPGVIPDASQFPPNSVPDTCTNQNICIIDNVSIEYAKDASGNVNINQVCGGCSTNANCKCIVENDRFILNNSGVLANANLDVSQVCGAGTFFYESSVDPLTGNVTYSQTGNPRQVIGQKNGKINWFLILVGVIILFVLFGIVGLFLNR